MDPGSLARAGKVRRWTPKVAKQEKNKTGRTKQWMQVNQRLVSVVPAFGKKKGPAPTLQSVVSLALPCKASKSSQQQQLCYGSQEQGHAATQVSPGATTAGGKGKHGPEPLLGFLLEGRDEAG